MNSFAIACLIHFSVWKETFTHKVNHDDDQLLCVYVSVLSHLNNKKIEELFAFVHHCDMVFTWCFCLFGLEKCHSNKINSLLFRKKISRRFVSNQLRTIKSTMFDWEFFFFLLFVFSYFSIIFIFQLRINLGKVFSLFFFLEWQIVVQRVIEFEWKTKSIRYTQIFRIPITRHFFLLNHFVWITFVYLCEHLLFHTSHRIKSIHLNIQFRFGFFFAFQFENSLFLTYRNLLLFFFSFFHELIWHHRCSFFTRQQSGAHFPNFENWK